MDTQNTTLATQNMFCVKYTQADGKTFLSHDKFADPVSASFVAKMGMAARQLNGIVSAEVIPWEQDTQNACNAPA